MIESVKYTTKVWLTTLLTPPLIFVIAIVFNDPFHLKVEIIEGAGVYIMFVFFSAVFSFIPWLVSLFVVYFIILQGANGIKARLSILLYGLLALVATVFVVLGNITIERGIWILILPYMVCLLASIYFYKLPEPYTNHQQYPIT